jgi:hypothetical protein
VRTVLKSGSLNLLEPSGPVQACNGIALPYFERKGTFALQGTRSALQNWNLLGVPGGLDRLDTHCVFVRQGSTVQCIYGSWCAAYSVCLTFKNRASYTQDGRTASLQMLHFKYFFQQL